MLVTKLSTTLDTLAGDGLCVIPGVLGDEALNELRADLDAINAAPSPYEKRYRHRHLTNKALGFRRLVEHPAALRIVETVLGDDCVLSSMNERSVRPGGKGQELHRDTEFWGPSFPWLPIVSGINVIWPLDDFTAESGSTLYVPGSHLSPESAAEAPRAVEAPAGSLVAFDTRLLHAGGANRGARLRRAVFAYYIRSWLKPQTDLKRSTPPEIVASASPVLLRLLGFRRQSPFQSPEDGSWAIVPAPGATGLYDEPLAPVAARHP